MPNLAKDAFAADLASLKEMGLNAHDLHALTIAGPAAAAILAQQIVERGNAAVQQVNSTGKQIRAAAREMATQEQSGA